MAYQSLIAIIIVVVLGGNKFAPSPHPTYFLVIAAMLLGDNAESALIQVETKMFSGVNGISWSQLWLSLGLVDVTNQELVCTQPSAIS